MVPVVPLWLHRFALFVSASTVVLLAAGALVTGTGSGLAVPDWPLSFGQMMPPMVGGVFYEHGHRMVAGTVAVFTVLLAIAFWRTESRRWVRGLAFAAVGAVFLQALLGGLTVLFRLPPAVSVSHACLAQLFFSITAVLVLVTSPAWSAPARPLAEEKGAWVSLPKLCLGLNGLFFLQLLMGASVRHLRAGLAIPDFPLSFGQVVPPQFTVPIAIHFAHRAGAFLLFALVFYTAWRISRRQGNLLNLVATAGALAALVTFQFMLGAFVVWLRRPVPITTTHLVVGALCLATSFLLTAQVLRHGQAPKEN